MVLQAIEQLYFASLWCYSQNFDETTVWSINIWSIYSNFILKKEDMDFRTFNSAIN